MFRKNNNFSHSTIFNRHGNALVTKSTFTNNTNEWGSVVSFYPFVTAISDSTFQNTQNYFTVGSVGGWLNVFNSRFVDNSNVVSIVHSVKFTKLCE